MKVPTQAKLEVIVDIDVDQVNEMLLGGITLEEIRKAVENSITLKEIMFRKPVMDIDNITLIKYS